MYQMAFENVNLRNIKIYLRMVFSDFFKYDNPKLVLEVLKLY